MKSRIPINPKLPARFDDMPNAERPPSHDRWWYRPYIQTQSFFGGDRDEWLKHWPTGIRYDVRCLDGGAWDRSTCLGCFATLDAAVDFANSWKPAACYTDCFLPAARRALSRVGGAA